MKRPSAPHLAKQLFGASPERILLLMRAAWPVAVGPELARRTEVVALDGGVLRVRVPDATWQRGLARMRGEIMSRLREIAGAAAPRSLGFVHGPVSAPSETTAASGTARDVPESPALLRPLSAQLAAAAQVIPDEELREGFLAAAERYLARFGRDSE